MLEKSTSWKQKEKSHNSAVTEETNFMRGRRQAEDVERFGNESNRVKRGGRCKNQNSERCKNDLGCPPSQSDVGGILKDGKSRS